jgi:hypothetical protein
MGNFIDSENKYVRTLHEMELGSVDKMTMQEKTFSAAVIICSSRT